jgi:septal ring factor EnvC (AmiA/AmiB activator)
MEASRKQQGESQAHFAQDLTNLRQQFGHLSGVHSSSEKKVADLGTQLTQAKQEVGNLKQQFTELSDAHWSSGDRIDRMRYDLEQTEVQLRKIWKRLGKTFPGFSCIKRASRCEMTGPGCPK